MRNRVGERQEIVAVTASVEGDFVRMGPAERSDCDGMPRPSLRHRAFKTPSNDFPKSDKASAACKGRHTFKRVYAMLW